MVMRKSVSVATLLFFGLTLARPTLARRRLPKKKEAEKGYLELTCSVEGATFVIDEGSPFEVTGKTPAAPIPLRPGTHTIKVTKEGYLPFADVFDIHEGETTELEVDLVLYSGRLRIEAEPAPVAVEVDGTYWGVAPLERDVSAGEHVIRLTKDGYVEQVKRVTVRSGQSVVQRFRLVPVAAVRKTSSKPIYKKWWFWTAIGAAVVAAIVPTIILARPKTVQATYEDVIPK